MQKRRYVNDNVHGLVRCTSLEALVMQQAVFSRLHGVYQNSVAYLTWPSNRNQRLEHSVGTMKLAGDMLFASIMNSDVPDREAFLRDAKESVSGILDGINGSAINAYFRNAQAAVNKAKKTWKQSGTIGTTKAIDELLGIEASGPLPDFTWRLVPGEVDRSLYATCYLLMQSVRMAGMLHDIGHPPFSHAVEHALEGLRRESDSPEYSEFKAADAFKDAMDGLPGIGKTHERIGMLLTKELFDVILGGLSDRGSAYAPLCIEYYIVYKMTDAILRESDKKERGLYTDIHRIVSSTVDADRLDFVRRDSLSSGIGLDAVQYPRIIGDMRLIERITYDKKHESYKFAFPTKTIDSLEAFIKQRFQNYDTVVWHHRVVKTEVLLDNIVLDLGKRELRNDEFSYGLASANHSDILDESHEMDDDPDKRHLPSNISGLWAPFRLLKENGTSANKQVFGQWNDAWLMTTLAGEYVNLCVTRELRPLSPEEDLLYGRLAELLYAERHYISIIKRFGDILLAIEKFDSLLSKRFLQEGKEIDEIRERLYSLAEPSRDTDGSADAQNIIDASASAAAFLTLLPPKDRKRVKGDKNNPLVYIRSHFDALGAQSKETDNYRVFIDNIIKDFMHEYSSIHEVKEHLVVHRDPDVGMDDPTYVYTQGGSLIDFDKVSNVRDSLMLDALSRPPFYVYVRFADKEDWTAEMEGGLRDDFIKYVAERLATWYTENLTRFLHVVE